MSQIVLENLNGLAGKPVLLHLMANLTDADSLTVLSKVSLGPQYEGHQQGVLYIGEMSGRLFVDG